jgi:hypothetical protein
LGAKSARPVEAFGVIHRWLNRPEVTSDTLPRFAIENGTELCSCDPEFA